MKKLLWAKFKESFLTVLPIIVIVLVLALTVAPMPFYSVVLFLLSALMMILGITLFNLGVDVSLMPIGEHIGSGLVKSRNLKLIVALTFVIGTFISIAEPDLHVLARQVSGIPDSVIILAVSAGVGLALVGAFLRILFQVRLSSILAVCYILAFIVSGFTSKNFLSVAWESGAVTTGPIMVPFVMALGLGLASVRGDKTSEEDSFGLVAFCLIGPILTMLLLGLFFEPSGGSVLAIPELLSLGDIFQLFLANFPEFIGQVALALLPILLLFIVFQVVSLRLRKRTLLKILIGTIYTYAGLVLFLTSVNVGFMPAGYQLGGALITNTPPWALILIGLATGGANAGDDLVALGVGQVCDLARRAEGEQTVDAGVHEVVDQGVEAREVDVSGRVEGREDGRDNPAELVHECETPCHRVGVQQVGGAQRGCVTAGWGRPRAASWCTRAGGSRTVPRPGRSRRCVRRS